MDVYSMFLTICLMPVAAFAVGAALVNIGSQYHCHKLMNK